VATAYRQGRLVSLGEPRQHDARRVRVDLVLLEAPVPAQRPVRARTVRHRVQVRPAYVVLILAALAALAALAWAVALLVQWVMAHLLLLVGALVVLGVLLILIGRSGRCPGLHCKGCGD